jgi:hypothetical protein
MGFLKGKKEMVAASSDLLYSDHWIAADNRRK